jgi:aspartate ammonia-lyase
MTDFRREKDSMGDRDLPNTAYYGIQTLRAIGEESLLEGLIEIQFSARLK